MNIKNNLRNSFSNLFLMIPFLNDPTGSELVQKLAQTPDHSIRVARVLTEPTSLGCNSIRYDFSEIALNPGEAIYFAVPESLSLRPVTFGTLIHRQDPDLSRGARTSTERDPIPAYASFQVYTPEKQWRFWEAPWSSGEWGPKYAEPRAWNNPETENLFDWGQLGTYDLESNTKSQRPTRATAIRVVSLGTEQLGQRYSDYDPTWVRSISLNTYPGDSSFDQEVTFTPGTRLGHPYTMEGLQYGGGPSHGGLYPHALALGPDRPASSLREALPNGWSTDGYALTIQLPEGKELLEVQIAAGDLKPDGKINKDGGTGSLGWSKLSVEYQQLSGKSEVLLSRQNIGPTGIYRASPFECNQKIRRGDTLTIRSDSDTAYLMGVKLRMN